MKKFKSILAIAKEDIKACTNCEHCTLYENENYSRKSESYICLLTDDMIPDIDQHCCDSFTYY